MGLFNQFPYPSLHELNADWLLKKMMEVDKTVDGLISEVQQMIDKAEVDFNKQFDAFRVEINATINKLNKQLIDFQNSIDKQFADYQAKLEGIINSAMDDVDAILTKFQAEVNAQLQLIRAMVKESEESTRRYVDGKIQEVIDMIPEITSVMVRNPVTGELQPIQDALDSLNNYYRYFGLTAIEYEERNWTAEEYDALGLTAFEYDFYAKEKFAWMSPYDGRWISTHQWLEWLTGLHRENALTAEEYDAIGITAEAYAALNISAYNYDFNGKNLVIV